MTTKDLAKSSKGFFTIGHSTRPLEEFINLLKENGITFLVDVRTMPRSRKNPQFNTENLEVELPKAGIDYRPIHSLSGFRQKSKTVDPEVNGYWQNQSFHNYADYAMTEEFASGLTDVLDIGQEHLTALMCAEVLWWRCHRRIIADYLLCAGAKVFHIIDEHKPKAATLPTIIKKKRSGALTYPKQTTPLDKLDIF